MAKNKNTVKPKKKTATKAKNFKSAKSNKTNAKTKIKPFDEDPTFKREERSKIKKLILNKAQEANSEIPLLSYSHLEVINPEHMDETLLEALDNDELEGGLTDKLFFDSIKESSDYLAYESFREKIKEWKKVLHSNFGSKGEREKAKNNLLPRWPPKIPHLWPLENPPPTGHI